MSALASAVGVSSIRVVAWRDFGSPDAGGSEYYVHEILSRWARAGLSVRLRTTRHRWDAPEADRGYLATRAGGRYLGFPRIISAGIAGRFGEDAVVEVWNGMPFLTPLWPRPRRRLVILHHVHGKEVWQQVLPGPLAEAGALFERRIAPVAYRGTMVATVSRSSADQIVSELGWPEDLVQVVPPGVKPEFRPGGAKAQFPLVVAVGRLAPTKRMDMVIDTVDKVRAHVPGVKLAIAGDGPERERLRQMVSDRRAEDWCWLLGRVPDESLARLYQRAWVVVSCSAAEGWGLTLTEAQACGTPVVATRIRGHMDSVVHGLSGLLCSGQSEMVAALTMLLSDEDLRSALTAGACQRASELSWDAAATRLFGLLAVSASALCPASSRTGQERRRHVRLPARVPCRVWAVPAQLVDVSRSGALVMVGGRTQLRPGDRVCLEIGRPYSQQGGVSPLMAKVVRRESRALVEALGLELERDLAVSELARILCP
jgi:glycosyltransferase involved in cell wall biosynthesis